jgi:pre-mRNA-splicing factor 38A
MSKPQFDRADAGAMLDDRGYRGALIRGQNPALLFEKGVRERITESYYWKEQCFGLNTASLCDRAAELKFIGGTTGINGKPTPFLCLAFKLLQLVPEKAIILEYLNLQGDEEEELQNGDVKKEEDGDMKKEEDGDMKKEEDGDMKKEEDGDMKKEEDGDMKKEEDGDMKKEDGDEADTPEKPLDLNAAGKLGSFKYLRCLAAFYIRLAWEPVEIYTTLEPLLTDYRKIKRRLKDTFTLTHIDQFVDDLLTKDRICATSLWKLPSRANLEDLEMLDPRESPLEGEVDELDEDMEKRSEGSVRSYQTRSYDSRSRSRSRSRSYDSRSRSQSRSPGERSERSTRSRTRSRSRSRRPDYSNEQR